MDEFLLVLIVGFPLVVFIISNLVRYLAIEETGQDRIRALSDLFSDIGLDFFYIGVSIYVSTLVVQYELGIPPITLLYLAMYSLLAAIISSLYNIPYETIRHNLCFIIGVIIGSAPIVYAFLVILTE